MSEAQKVGRQRARPGRLSHAKRIRWRLHGDQGTSLMELMVGMSLMGTFMAMFTGAVLMMNNAMNRTQAVNQSSSQVNTAFLALDSSVRYAAFISTPGLGASGNWYVELRVTNTGTEVCNQLRVDIASQQLQRRTWTVTNGTATSPTAWKPISSSITNGAAVAGPLTQPFYLVPGRSNTVYQQLTVILVSTSGPVSAQTSSSSRFTFTAINSVIPAPTSPICQQQGRP